MIADKDAGATAGATLNRARPGSAVSDPPLKGDPRIESAIEATTQWLLDRQHPDGYWVGELEGDTILESEYVLLMTFLGREAEEVCVKACRYMRDREHADGGWAIYPGGPPEVSASVKAYLAMKIVGVPLDDPVMVRAREVILNLGGIQACNSFTRFYLALLGQIPYDHCPTVPPELVLIPSWLNFSLAAMSSWTRTIVVPLAIISALKPVKELPARSRIDELFRTDRPRNPSRWTSPTFSWGNFFLVADRVLKVADRWLPKASRKPGIDAAHRWIRDHFENSDGLGAIYPPMIYTVIVLKVLGYEPNSAPSLWAMRQLDDLMIEEDGKVRFQPCISPVWDTAITAIALSDAGVSDEHPAMARACQWLLDKEVRTAGDWSVRRPGVEPSGWYFQNRNEHYPDIDDTAMVLMSLQRSSDPGNTLVAEATKRGVNWLLAMQNRDGGWAAFDVDIDNEVLTKVPFADHNAMLDPSCADITARIIESLGMLGHKADEPSIVKGLEYLWRTQEPEGSWYGRWGVNYVYGTWQVLQGLKAIDLSMELEPLRKAADWLESVQNPNGGWGESCARYGDRSLMGQGETTASQTAWAVLGLIAAGRADSLPVHRGIAYLLETQAADGSWPEDIYTGTGFPLVFYMKYHYYRIYFPLMALARYQSALGGKLAVCLRIDS